MARTIGLPGWASQRSPRQLGIELPFATFFAHVEKHAKSPWANLADACGEGGLKLLLTALTSEHGHAMAVVYGHTILAARTHTGEQVVYAESQPYKKWGWKIKPRWYGPGAQPPDHRELARRSGARATIPITRAFVPLAPDDRGAALLAAV